MPHATSSNLPSNDHLLNRENSLPTYEEAVEKVGSNREIGFVPPTAPALPSRAQHDVNNTRSAAYYVSDCSPVSQTAPRAAPRAAPREGDIEQALTDTTMLRHEDPVVREMAQTVLAECRRAKEKRETKQCMNAVGCVVVVILVIVMVFVKASTGKW